MNIQENVLESDTDSKHDIINSLVSTAENIIEDLEKENTRLTTQLDTIYGKLLECIDTLTNIEDNLYMGFERLEERIKNKNPREQSELDIDWLDIELKIYCHDVLYKPMTQMVNTLKYIVDERDLTPNNIF